MKITPEHVIAALGIDSIEMKSGNAALKEEQITSLNEAMDADKKKIQELENSLKEKEKEISDLQAKVEELEKEPASEPKKVVDEGSEKHEESSPVTDYINSVNAARAYFARRK